MYTQLMIDCCAAETREEASAVLESWVRICRLDAHWAGHLDDAIREVLLQNIGYMTGYYPLETADRIFELFDTEHPYFGRTHPSPEEALAIGIREGSKMRVGPSTKEKSGDS